MVAVIENPPIKLPAAVSVKEPTGDAIAKLAPAFPPKFPILKNPVALSGFSTNTEFPSVWKVKFLALFKLLVNPISAAPPVLYTENSYAGNPPIPTILFVTIIKFVEMENVEVPPARGNAVLCVSLFVRTAPGNCASGTVPLASDEAFRLVNNPPFGFSLLVAITPWNPETPMAGLVCKLSVDPVR